MQAFCNTSCDFHIEKTGCSEPIKKQINFNIYNVALFKKK